MNKKIVVINGSGGVGKDAFVLLCQEELGADKVWNYSSVDKVKEIAYACGWDGTKTEAARKFLSDLKDLTERFNEMPYRSMVEKIESFKRDEYAQILFLHIREPEQISRMCNEFNAASVLVTRAGHEQIISNHADAGVYEYTYDYEIHNNGTLDDLAKTAADWCDTLLAPVA